MSMMFLVLLDKDLGKNLDYVIVMTIVSLLFPTLYGKRGIFTRSPLLWVCHPLSFCCYHVV